MTPEGQLTIIINDYARHPTTDGSGSIDGFYHLI